MIIYADKDAQSLNGMPMTPHVLYQSNTDFATILDAISNGVIPTGTGKPFPVNYDLEYDGSNFDEASIPF